MLRELHTEARYLIDSFPAMGNDAARFIQALGYEQVDVLGFSISGCVAQELTVHYPQLVRKLILAATAPRGEEGMNHRGPEIIKIVTAPIMHDEGYLTIFFNQTPASQALGKAFLARRGQRTANFDGESSAQTAQAQGAARQPLADTHAGIKAAARLVQVGVRHKLTGFPGGCRYLAVPPGALE